MVVKEEAEEGKEQRKNDVDYINLSLINIMSGSGIVDIDEEIDQQQGQQQGPPAIVRTSGINSLRSKAPTPGGRRRRRRRRSSKRRKSRKSKRKRKRRRRKRTKKKRRRRR